MARHGIVACCIWIVGVTTFVAKAEAGQFAGGTGEPNDPFQIATAEQLVSVGSDPNLLDKHFVLLNDIDLDPNLAGGRVFTQAVIAPSTVYPSYLDPTSSGGFGGSLDGNGHVIKNLTMWGDTGGCLGLFGYVASTGRVRRVKLDGASVTTSNRGAGTLCYYNRGLIEDCNARGAIVGTWFTGGLVACNRKGTISRCHAAVGVRIKGLAGAVGGLVGENCGTIADCGAAGIVECEEDCWDVGGLTGRNGMCWDMYFPFWLEGAVVRSRSTGDVVGGSRASGVGGLVGWNYCGVISDCYATGGISAVKESECIGGLLGGGDFSDDTSFLSGAVVRCYASGKIIADESSDGPGGVMGLLEGGGNAVDSFWDVEISRVQVSNGGTGLTTAQMQTGATFIAAGWDFEKVWMICEGRDYPRLRWERVECNGNPIPGGAGEPNDPYRIATADQLVSIGSDPNRLNKYFVLVNDIDLDPNLPGGRVFEDAVIAPCNGPIDDNGLPIDGFAGSFDGNGYAIRNLNMHDDAEEGLGLFGSVMPTGRVRRLNLENVRITAAGKTGSLAYLNRGTIEDCNVVGSIVGLGGGIAYGFGGLVGSNWQGVISRCQTAVDIRVEVKGDAIGGMVGENAGTITDCGSAGAISCRSGGWDVGGLVGSNGIVVPLLSGPPYGSVVMYMDGTIRRCRATGDVFCEFRASSVGGLVGSHYAGTIADCYATGSISSRGEGEWLGGLVGASDSEAVDAVVVCYAIGGVASGVPSEDLGGLVGRVGWGEKAKESFWDTQTSGMLTSEGGTGLLTAQMQTAATFIAAGWDFDEVWMICEGRDYPRLRWEGVDCGRE